MSKMHVQSVRNVNYARLRRSYCRTRGGYRSRGGPHYDLIAMATFTSFTHF